MELDYAIIETIEEIKSLVNALGINSPEDIPVRDNFKIKTFKDAWYAKLYKQGLEIDADIIDDIPEGKFKEIVKKLTKEFSSGLSLSGAGPKGLVQQLNSFKNKFIKLDIPNYLNKTYDENLLNKSIFIKSQSQKEALKEAVKDFKAGKISKPIPVSNVFSEIPTDNMMQKILNGINRIKDTTVTLKNGTKVKVPAKNVRSLVLLSLFGTRGEQIKRLKSDVLIAKQTRPQSPYYNRGLGAMKGLEVTVGKKALVDNVPFGPFMKDMLDFKYDQITNRGVFSKRSLFSQAESKLNLGNIIDKYLFNDPSGKHVLDAKDISFLGRQGANPAPRGYTDLRRLVLSWAADKSGQRKLAAELLTHGVQGSSDVTDLVTEKYYIKGERTPVKVLQAFTTMLEQNVARVTGHTTYKSFNKFVGVDKYNRETKKVKSFAKETIIPKFDTKVVVGEVVRGETVAQGVDPKLYKEKIRSDIKRSIVAAGTANEVDIKNLMKEDGLTRAEAEARLGIGDSKLKPLTEVETNLKNKALSFLDKFKKQTREAVGDISQTFDKGVDRLTSKAAYKETAEMFLDPEEWQRAAKQLAPLGMLVGGKFVKAGKLAYGVGKAIVKPSQGILGRAEVTAETMFTAEEHSGVAEKRRALAAASERKEDAQSLADIEYDMQQNQSQIGDGELPIDQQMNKFGF